MSAALEKIDALLLELEKLTGKPAFSSDKPRFTLGYWRVHGLAQPARLMLVYGGHSNFEDVTYNRGPPPDYNREEWMRVKFSLHLDFPNVPYLIDHKHNLRITESHAIYRYLGRELGIGATCSKGTAYEEMIGDVLKDLLGKWGGVCYCPPSDYEKQKEEFIKQLPEWLEPLEKYLKGTDAKRNWLGGKHLCYGDFILHEFLVQTMLFCPKVYDKFPELTRVYKEFKALPQLQDYFKSDAYCKFPFGGPTSNFNN